MADTEAQEAAQAEESAAVERGGTSAEDEAGAGTSADKQAGAGDGAGTSADKEAQILLEERETVSEAVPGGMFGAVMVEVCVTLPRAR